MYVKIPEGVWFTILLHTSVTDKTLDNLLKLFPEISCILLDNFFWFYRLWLETGNDWSDYFNIKNNDLFEFKINYLKIKNDTSQIVQTIEDLKTEKISINLIDIIQNLSILNLIIFPWEWNWLRDFIHCITEKDGNIDYYSKVKVILERGNNDKFQLTFTNHKGNYLLSLNTSERKTEDFISKVLYLGVGIKMIQ